MTVGYDANGKRKRRYLYARTKADLFEKLDELRKDVASGMLTEPTQMKVAEYLQHWLEDSARPTIRATTYLNYSSVVRNHLIPTIGGVKLSKLSPLHVQALHTALEERGASPRLRQLVHAVLSRSLRQALRLGLIARNPCAAVDRPQAPRKEIKALTGAEVERLFEAAKGDPLEALYITAVGTGARVGELLALRWEDIDLPKGTVAIRRTLVDLNGRIETNEPKTAKGRRRIDLPAFVVGALRSHRLNQPAEPHPTAWVFSDSKGGPLRKSNLLRRLFRPLLKRAGLPPIRFHDLRHTAASLLLAQGVHPKVVQERLGHATIAITLDTYSHVVPSLQREAADQLDALLGKGR